jgi:hypothetical protein
LEVDGTRPEFGERPSRDPLPLQNEPEVPLTSINPSAIFHSEMATRTFPDSQTSTTEALEFVPDFHVFDPKHNRIKTIHTHSGVSPME